MRTLLLCTIMFMSLPLCAQDDNEYKMEIGTGAGMMSYQGDFNGSITSNMQPYASIVLRRVFNPYMGLKLDLSFGKIKGNTGNADTWYPDFQAETVEFTTDVTDISLTYEYNFWPYGTGREYRGAKRITPFIFFGLGATIAKADDENVFTANIPIGLGVKYKINSRLNLGLEWAEHFSLSDKLDGVEDPYYIKSSGLFKNKDSYSMLKLTLTYSFMAKCKTCNKYE